MSDMTTSHKGASLPPQDVELPAPPHEWSAWSKAINSANIRASDSPSLVISKLREAFSVIAQARASRSQAGEVAEIVGMEKRGFSLMTVVRWEPGFAEEYNATPTPQSPEPPDTLTFCGGNKPVLKREDVEAVSEDTKRLDALNDAITACEAAQVQEVVARRDQIRDAVAQSLGSLYVCGRVWEAWQFGTMTQDDFSPAEEDEDVLNNITESVIDALSQPTIEADSTRAGGEVQS